jgi:hypothetical protein
MKRRETMAYWPFLRQVLGFEPDAELIAVQYNPSVPDRIGFITSTDGPFSHPQGEPLQVDYLDDQCKA